MHCFLNPEGNFFFSPFLQYALYRQNIKKIINICIIIIIIIRLLICSLFGNSRHKWIMPQCQNCRVSKGYMGNSCISYFLNFDLLIAIGLKCYYLVSTNLHPCLYVRYGSRGHELRNFSFNFLIIGFCISYFLNAFLLLV